MISGPDGALHHHQLHDMVVERWGCDIVSGALPVGTCWSAETAATQLGVSRTVVREAVRVLESMGLVSTRRRMGITVRASSAWNAYDQRIIRWRLAGPDRVQQLGHFDQLRSVVEPLAARLAAARATATERELLTAAVIGMSVAARAGNAAGYHGLVADFHRVLLRASGNPMLASLTDGFAARVLTHPAHDGIHAATADESVRLYGVVASAVQAGDGGAAETAMVAIVLHSTAPAQPLRPPPKPAMAQPGRSATGRSGRIDTNPTSTSTNLEPQHDTTREDRLHPRPGHRLGGGDRRPA